MKRNSTKSKSGISFVIGEEELPSDNAFGDEDPAPAPFDREPALTPPVWRGRADEPVRSAPPESFPDAFAEAELDDELPGHIAYAPTEEVADFREPGGEESGRGAAASRGEDGPGRRRLAAVGVVGLVVAAVLVVGKLSGGEGGEPVDRGDARAALVPAAEAGQEERQARLRAERREEQREQERPARRAKRQAEQRAEALTTRKAEVEEPESVETYVPEAPAPAPVAPAPVTPTPVAPAPSPAPAPVPEVSAATIAGNEFGP